ncbi:MAG: pentapeptide repeat-containing protein [Alphaproteobacteria bacterium]|nr:pentapeptide repeat-containing protein [Alphaproteobacteria bacterium]
MPNAEALKALQAGRLEWEQFRAKAFKGTNGKRLTAGRIDLRSADLRYMNLSGYDLSRVDFSAMPEKVSKPKVNGDAANDHVKGNGKDPVSPESSSADNKDGQDALARADLSFANLSGAYLFGSRFCGTRLAGTDLSEANIGGAEFIEAVLDHKSSLRRAKGDDETLFKQCRIDGTDLSGADLSGTSFEGSRLHDADLSGVRFFRARLNGTSWRGARIDERTDFEQADFPEHEPGLDQSEHMILPSGINWTHARWIGDKVLPVFAALGLAICFVIISAVRAAHNGMAPGSVFGLISPAAIHALMIGFAFILAGVILFRRRCPEEVKNFTVAQWVHLAGHPRPVYLARALKGRTEAIASLALVVIGFLVLGFAAKTIILAAACPACFAAT